jgi:hypothetical protein
MKISFVMDTGELYALEVDPNMEMESLMALLEVEVGRNDIYCAND